MKTSFRFQKLTWSRLVWTAETVCIACGREFTVKLHEVHPVFRAGGASGEIVGVVCSSCLSEDSRECLSELRRAGETLKR